MAVQTTEPRRLVTGGDPDAVYAAPLQAQFIDPISGEILDFIPAVDLEHIAGILIGKHDETLGAADQLRVAYRWKREGGETGGKRTLGACVKANPLLRHLSEYDIVIWLASDHLRGQTAYVIEAALFHELLHIEVNDKGKPTLAPHDYAGFLRELREYGAWYTDLRMMADSARQLGLFDGER